AEQAKSRHALAAVQRSCRGRPRREKATAAAPAAASVPQVMHRCITRWWYDRPVSDKRLGASDAMFLYGETRETMFHVAGLLPFTPAPDTPPDHLRHLM